MVPYHGRLALRIARLVLAVACAAAYVRTAGFGQNWVTALIAAYTVYSLGAVFAVRYETPIRAATAIVADATNFAIWTWQAPGDWQPALACGYLLGSTVLLHDLVRAAITFAAALFIALILPPGRNGNLVWTVVASGGAAAAVGLYKRYLEERMSTTLRHNVMIRSQSQLAREAERQRIAADFHDGPLQSFISFQMRLEVIRKLMQRDIEAGTRNSTSCRNCASRRWPICAASCAACGRRMRVWAWPPRSAAWPSCSSATPASPPRFPAATCTIRPIPRFRSKCCRSSARR